MASIRRKTGSRYWFACFYREDSSRAQVSTKTTDRKLALRVAAELEEAHRARATEGQMRRVLSELKERLTGEPLKSTTLEKYAAEWLAGCEGRVAKPTLVAYRSAVSGFVQAMGAKAALPLTHLTLADVRKYRDDSAKRTTARTGNNRLKIVRVFLQAAKVDGYIERNVATDVPVLDKDESVRRPFRVDELKRMLDVADGEWRGLVLAGTYTGQRLKDLCLLQWASVDTVAKEIKLTTSKTGRQQTIPIAEPLLEDLLARAGDDPRGYVFPQTAALVLKDGDVGRVSQGFRLLLEKANLVAPRLGKDESKGVGRSGRRERSELSFHSLRHTATSLLKNAGVTELIARDLIGHDSEAVSRNYSHVDADLKRKAIAGLPDITK